MQLSTTFCIQWIILFISYQSTDAELWLCCKRTLLRFYVFLKISSIIPSNNRTLEASISKLKILTYAKTQYIDIPKIMLKRYKLSINCRIPIFSMISISHVINDPLYYVFNICTVKYQPRIDMLNMNIIIPLLYKINY